MYEVGFHFILKKKLCCLGLCGVVLSLSLFYVRLAETRVASEAYIYSKHAKQKKTKHITRACTRAGRVEARAAARDRGAALQQGARPGQFFWGFTSLFFPDRSV